MSENPGDDSIAKNVIGTRAIEHSVSGSVLGVDIGGAHLKYATTEGISKSHFFPMWTDSDRLSEAILSDLIELGHVGPMVVTMTGEMADCFADRQSGVAFVVDAVCDAWKQCVGDFGRQQEANPRAQAGALIQAHELRFYGVGNVFLSASDAKVRTRDVASANWHAAGQWAATMSTVWNAARPKQRSETDSDGQSTKSDGLYIDIGSTTTDLIPFFDGNVATQSITDHDRLLEQSLVYVGCGRTPVCSLVDALEHDSRRCLVMNEVFATIDDAMIILGLAAEAHADTFTADGRPRTLSNAMSRLARTIGLDGHDISSGSARVLSHQIVNAAGEKISAAIDEIDPGGLVVFGGHGNALFELPVVQSSLARRDQNERRALNLTDLLGFEVSRCLPAYAAAMLWKAKNYSATPPAHSLGSTK